MGGLKLAYRAFLAWYSDKEGSAPPRHEQQLVFIAFGQNWCDKEQVSLALLGLLVQKYKFVIAFGQDWCDKEQASRMRQRYVGMQSPQGVAVCGHIHSSM